MEIGLAHADITERMCDAWMSTIMHTICHRGGMNPVTLNKKGFFLLARLPDIWKRMQTSRATELFVNLNTKYCLSGKSTIARFCSLMGLPASEVVMAVTLLEQKNTINKRQNCRLSATIQYLKKLDINVSNRVPGDTTPLLIVENIKETLVALQEKDKKERITVYTDGSTNSKGNVCNSGSSIIVTDSKDRTIWSGGMTVRADGNNFIPELAAAATAIKACPVGLPMTLRIDSTAAIGAISKGVLSERKRVRAAGRAWLNFSRQDFMEKRHAIQIQHVSSHKGTVTTEQKGNDLADSVAKEYLRQGQSKPADQYFMEAGMLYPQAQRKQYPE
jgi:hypothetical protein